MSAIACITSPFCVLIMHQLDKSGTTTIYHCYLQFQTRMFERKIHSVAVLASGTSIFIFACKLWMLCLKRWTILCQTDKVGEQARSNHDRTVCSYTSEFS